MGILKTGISAIGKLFIVVALAGTFLVGMVGVVYLSLRGEEVVIPEIVGKNFSDSEKELAALGLKLKKVRNIYSKEKPNTILEQRPRAGEIGKTGLMVSVYVAEPNPDGQETPATIIKDDEEGETAPDLEIPSDKKKSNKNANVKKAATTRDVEKSNKNSNSNTAANSLSSGNQSGTNLKSNTSTQTAPANKNNPTLPANKTIIIPSSSPKPGNSPKPSAAKTSATGGDMRTRRVN